MDRLRVLWLAPVCPFPAWGGNHQRHMGLLRAIALRHDVLLLYPSEKGAVVPDELRQLCEVRPVPNSSVAPGRVRRVARRLAGHADCFVPRNIADIADAVRNLCATRSFDVAFSSVSVASALTDSGIELRVIDEQNVEARLYDQLWRREPNALRRAARWHDAKLVDGVERSGLRQASLVTAVSADDASLLLERVPGIAPINIVPNGVDTSRVAYFEGPRDEQRILMVGGMSYAPNVDGACFLVREVMPLVWRDRPNAVVEIVGSNPSPEVRALASERVIITGGVPDLTPHLRGATVEVVPLRSGGGTRLKILEAMAAGVPLVSTTRGAEGLSLRSGVELQIADSAPELARAVAAVLNEPGAFTDMTRAARRRVVDDYDWTRIGSAFVDVLEQHAHAAR